jgi:hypothetical protein
MIGKRIILLVVLSYSGIYPSISQSFSLEFGSANFPNMVKPQFSKEINDRKVTSSENYFKLSYEQKIRRKIFISGSYCSYPINTYFNFYKGSQGNGVGWIGTKVSRIDISIQYSILGKCKFFILPNVGIGVQKSKPKGIGFGSREITQSFIPNPEIKLVEDIQANAHSNTQLVPIIGLKFGYVFWRRLELFFQVQHVFGNKTIQELRMNYTYKGVEQPEATSYSDGTGRFYTLGLGFRFDEPEN